jgi:hypothetical protein
MPPGEFAPYCRIRRIDWGYPGWDALLQRRAGLLKLRDKYFLPQGTPSHLYTEEQMDVAVFFGEMLQHPTHMAELGYRLGSRCYPCFRAGFNFGFFKFIKPDHVAQEIGRALTSYLRENRKLEPGIIEELRSENYQQFWLSVILAKYKQLKALGD